ncbi:unnamed protein product [Urochloa humidicola]
MEKAALSVGKSVLKGALSYAKSAIAEEVALQLGVQRDQAFIRDELEMMQAFLMAAHEDRDENKLSKIWVKQVRDVAYDVEDYLQDFALRLGKRPCWRIPCTLPDGHHVAKKMKELRSKVEDVSKRNARYRLKGSGPNPGAAALQSSNTGAIEFGFEEAKRQLDKAGVDLSNLIERGDKNLQVISVWGASSVLDPTPIRRAYDELKRKKRFQCYAWVRVMHPFNLFEFLHSIMQEFYLSAEEAGNTPEKVALGAQVLKKMEKMTTDYLVDQFSEHVRGKSYLVVLNDLSTFEEWKLIKSNFPPSENGCRVIVSTEQCEVAKLCLGEAPVVQEALKQSSEYQDITYAIYDKGLQDLMKAGSSSDTDNNDKQNNSNNNTVGDMPAYTEPLFVGREKDKADIIKLISDEGSKELKVISICGMGGVGKTILAKYVYQNPNAMFEKHAFVTVNCNFDLKGTINSLFMLLKEKPEEKNDNVIRTSLQGLIVEKRGPEDQPSLATILEQKKYLIVLDDLSTIKQWDVILNEFPKTSTTASRIIVTTRHKEIAKHCSQNDDNYIFNLGKLSIGDARDLFMEKVFRKDFCKTEKVFKEKYLEHEYPELALEAESILRKCDGLPLAISTIGAFLADQPKTVVELRSLNSHIRGELDTNPRLGMIKDVLSKSFDGLPYHLKSCFLYLSIFPEHHNISRRRLVRRWLAEGYSIEAHTESQEETADKYFMQLINRSMIQPNKNSIRSRKAPDSCQVHDMMREISILKSTDENLVLRLEAKQNCSLNMQGKPRHLVVSNNWNGGKSQFESIVDPSGIRSLTVFGKWHAFLLSRKMRFLRVLDLEGTSELVQHHLEHIGEFLHMKYLSLRGCRGVSYLPDSIGNLKQLQTLDIAGTSIIKLPKTIVKLRKLQYLRGWAKFQQKRYYLTESCAACCAPSIMGDVLESSGNYFRRDVCTFCCCLMFPACTGRLNAPGVVVPRGIRRLKDLHTLAGVNVAGNKAILHDIRRLTRLRKLAATNINSKNCEDLCSALARLRNLESLLVRSDGELGLDGCLESLQSLKLVGKLKKLPEWVPKLKNLVKLKLKLTMISQSDATIIMENLGRLPNLNILRLLRGSFQGDKLRLEFPAGEAFPSLKLLEVDRIKYLQQVNFAQGATPKLELLQYRDHGHREGNDSLFSGIASLTNLKEFLLCGVCNEAIVKDVEQQLKQNTSRAIINRL